MLDMDFIVQNPDVVKRAIEVKQVDLDLDRLLALHGEVKELLGRVEELRRDRNVDPWTRNYRRRALPLDGELRFSVGYEREADRRGGAHLCWTWISSCRTPTW